MTQQPTVPEPLLRLRDAGVAIWLDDLSRGRIASGSLARMVEERCLVGITTNPTIFASALSGDAYDEQLGDLARSGVGVEQAVRTITTDDVRDACDVLAGVFEDTDGVDGRVSIEVDPRLARDTDATLAEARSLWATVDRPNLFIKIPATVEGLPAITAALAEGISVNVTLIFSQERYAAVRDAFLEGMERARSAGRDLTRLASVASFFVSRVDTAVDARLDEIGTPEARALRGRAAIANARLAYAAYREMLATDRWRALAAAGARPQRPLWASTGVKDPAYRDTLYVEELVAPEVVNTMPEATLEAVAAHGDIRADAVTGREQEAADVLAAVERLDISMAEITHRLEVEGVAKFEESWADLLATVEQGLTAARGPAEGAAR